jgi:hypothetical protein
VRDDHFVEDEAPVEAAVVDRVVEGQAVLLIGEKEIEEVVPLDDLPAGVGGGVWLLVRRTRDGIQVVGIDPEAEQRQRERARRRLRRLREERGGGRFSGRGGTSG